MASYVASDRSCSAHGRKLDETHLAVGVRPSVDLSARTATADTAARMMPVRRRFEVEAPGLSRTGTAGGMVRACGSRSDLIRATVKMRSSVWIEGVAPAGRVRLPWLIHGL